MEKLVKSFGYAFYGLKDGFEGRNFKIQTILAILVSLAGLYFEVSSIEWAILFLCFGTVLAMELGNTAIEELANTVRDENKLSYKATKRCRDLAAGGVFVMSVFTILVAFCIFVPKMFNL